jgi:flagellar secretion chaperone FliS
MSARLLTANLKNQPELVEEVLRLLTELKSAWDQIDPARSAAPAPAPAQRSSGRDVLAPLYSTVAKA